MNILSTEAQSINERSYAIMKGLWLINNSPLIVTIDWFNWSLSYCDKEGSSRKASIGGKNEFWYAKFHPLSRMKILPW